MWLDGRPYWNGMQMDEAAFPILLFDMLRRHSPFILGDLNAGGPWSAGLQASSCAMVRLRNKTDGKKMRAIRHLLWR